MTDTLTSPADRATQPSPPISEDPSRRVDWRRLRHPITAFALTCAAIGAVSTTLGTVVAGRLAEDPTAGLLQVLAVMLVGASFVDTLGKITWVGMSDRAEGALREDLLDAAMDQPLAALGEQAVGEILDRVDDDTHEVGNLVRWQLWMLARTVFGVLPMWIVAGLTWWPSWILFPLLATVTLRVIRPLLGEISRLAIKEEMAWTDHAAALEEGIAGRDDLRTSLGQSHVISRLAKISSTVHTRFLAVVRVESRLARRAGLLLHVLLVGIGVAGVALASNGDLSVARLVTLFLVTTTFVGQISMLANHLPDLQAGLGAVIRLRQMLAVEPEATGGQPMPVGPGLGLAIRDLDFSYTEGSFALRGVSLAAPAGQTIALVGRTGSGKSTLASLLSRAVEPPRGTVFLGGIDVLDLELQQLRADVGVVTQRTEILAGTLAENITLFGDQPREQIERAVAELGLDGWVAGLQDGLDTVLGPGGITLSAGEEQLVAFARLLVRDVQVVVLDEATARMDPLTEQRVVVAADRLLTGRTGVLIAHRLSTIERAPLVAVLNHGRVVQQGRRDELALSDGPFRDLLTASRVEHDPALDATEEDEPEAHATLDHATHGAVGGRRRTGAPPEVPEVGDGPSLARGILSALLVQPKWGIAGALLFLGASLTGAQGAFTGLIWGNIVENLQDGEGSALLVIALAVSLVAAPLMLADAFWRYPLWWVEVMLRTRMAVLNGQTAQRRLPRTPPGEVVARSMDADRYARYADRWVDFLNGLAIAAVAAVLAGTWVAGTVLLVVMVTSALASTLGRPFAGRSAAAASTARARFGRALVSALDGIRT
ncbi:MAG: ABC transporter ATP-binding protein/permease, partial [Nocardioides sp.]|nr:ABC transporter ATP-binding protein/permease [Nocardioides sp.]